MNYNTLINETASRHYNVADEYKNNTVEENREHCRKDSLPFSIASMSVAGDLNIGMMMRTASLLGVRDFFIFGRKKYDKRSTVGAQNYINVHRYPMDTKSVHEVCKRFGYVPIWIEHSGLTLPLSNHEWDLITMGNRPMFVFGSESDGIPSEIMNTFPYSPTITIPQHGVLRSYNVASAMSIVTWEYNRRFQKNRRMSNG